MDLDMDRVSSCQRPSAPAPPESAAAASDNGRHQPGRKDSVAVDAALANEIFEHFMAASTFKAILRAFRYLCEVLRVKPGPMPMFYPRLKAKLRSWRAQALWTKYDKRSAFKVYKGGRACAGQNVLVIGCGPCGLRTAIEAQLLGARVVVVEKRDRFSRNNVLHLWPYNIADLRGLGAKKFYGKFCAGAIDHISIRQLQCILLKAALLLGVEVFECVSFESLVEPKDAEIGWRMAATPADHPVTHYEFDVLVAADGKRNTLEGFKRKEFRGKLAIAITANFINRHSEAESRVEEISGVAYIFNPKFFNDMSEQTGISLENIVYYKDETHYFVMTAKKQSLLNKGVLLKNETDAAKLLASDNINQEALFRYAREAADFATNYKLPELDFAVNHYGKPDVAMFDFTSMYQADHSCRVIDRHGHRLLAALVGDSLLEPFWPTGTGCPRGFFGGLDLCWLMRSLAIGKQTLLEALAERESIYRVLAQTTPENTSKDYASYTVDPCTRYPTLNKRLVLPFQVRQLVDSDNPSLISDELALVEANVKSRAAETPQECYRKASTVTAGGMKRTRRESHVSPDALLAWFQKQLSTFDCLSIVDTTYSFQDGLALCAIIYRFRPDLVDFRALDPAAWAENNQLAFDLLEQELGILPIMTGAELATSKCPDKLTMIAYLSQVYEAFRKEIPVLNPSSSVTKLDASDEDLLDLQYRHNHAASKPSRAVRRKMNDPSAASGAKASSIGQLVASEAISRKKKRRSKDTNDTADPVAEVEPNNKENIQETMRMNRSANRKRLEQMMKRAEESEKARRAKHGEPGERRSIKKEERYKIIEERFAGGGSKRRSGGESAAKYRENKKPKDLKRAIGKLNKNDWNIKNIEETFKVQQAQAGSEKGPHAKDRVPKWSKDAFQDKFNIMKGKLESAGPEPNDKGKDRLADIDTSLARLQKKLREGSTLETGQRGANKVSALAEELFPESKDKEVARKPSITRESGDASADPLLQPKREFVMGKGGSETCHFCEKRVYVVERMSAEGKFFHRSCFRCCYCNILLRLGSYVYHREGPFGGKFFCIPHSTENALEKYRYRKKTDELQDRENRVRELKANAVVANEWDQKDSGALDHLKSLPERHKERLLSSLEHDLRGSTPERVEFEVSMDFQSEEDAPSIMDEDEWTDRNFGNSFQNESREKKKVRYIKGSEETGKADVNDTEDTSDDSVSDLDTDTSEEDEEVSGMGPESRPLTADETRRLQREWIKKYDPGTDSEDDEKNRSAYENLKRRVREASASSVDSTEDDDDEDYEEDYDGEYESDSTSDEADSDLEAAVPPPPPQRRHHNIRERYAHRMGEAAAGSDTTTTSDSSTEVGSEDLSSAEDTETESDLESDFTSGSATECEFTDSEGRPNPFHKQLEPPKLVVEPASPDPIHRPVVILERPHKPAPTVPVEENNSAEANLPSMTASFKYQYKTPNLSDRLQSEQKRASATSKLQDFSTRRALSLKKNWVSEAPANAFTSKKSDDCKAEIDNRLKSLMDRLSNQQKLLKPAEKPSTQMQHFLDNTGKAPVAAPATSAPNASSLKSPPMITSPPAIATEGSESGKQGLKYGVTSIPPVYKSQFSEEAVTALSGIESTTGQPAAADCVDGAAAEAQKQYEDVESIAVPELPAKVEVLAVSEEETEEDSSQESTDHEQQDEKLGDPSAEGAAAVLVTSTEREDDFQSCNEEPDEQDASPRLTEAVNTHVQSSSNANELSDQQPYQTPEEAPSNVSQRSAAAAEPLAASSPLHLHEAVNMEFIDEDPECVSSDEASQQEEEVMVTPSVEEAAEELSGPAKEMSPPPLFTEDEFTKAYRERDPSTRVARLADARQKEKSVVHDLILSRVSSNMSHLRSSSAARRANRNKLPTSSVPPIPTGESSATPRAMPTKDGVRRAPVHLKFTPTAAASGERGKSKIEQMDFPLIDDENAQSSAQSTPVKKVSLPDTPLTNPEKFGIAKSSAGAAMARASRPPARLDSMPPMRRSHTTLEGSNYISRKPNPDIGVAPLASPSHSTGSNDLEYMDGIVSSTDELSSPSKGSSSTSKSGKEGKKTFMKTISGIFSRSSSLSSVSKQQQQHQIPGNRSSLPVSAGSNDVLGGQQSSSTAVPKSQLHAANSLSNNSANKQDLMSNLRFPRLNFRSSSVSRVTSSKENNAFRSPGSPEAPKADISELGSLASLSISASTPRKEPSAGGGGGLFRTTSLQMATSHPSTPPVPLSRKITFGAGEGADSLSENEENESPEASLNSANGDSHPHAVPENMNQLPPELLEKIMRRGKGAKRAARVAEVKRVRKAQEIQRHLEELDVQHKELEERGILMEKSIRGEEAKENASEAELMQSWFQLLVEKNRLVRREQELMVQAKHLELEDRSARLEAELREHLMLDARSGESVVREGQILKELLEISEQREKLQSMLERDKVRYQKEDQDIEAQMLAQGIRVSTTATTASGNNGATPQRLLSYS